MRSTYFGQVVSICSHLGWVSHKSENKTEISVTQQCLVPAFQEK